MTTFEIWRPAVIFSGLAQVFSGMGFQIQRMNELSFLFVEYSVMKGSCFSSC